MVILTFSLVVLLSLLFFYLATGKDGKMMSFFILWQVVVGVLVFYGLFKDKPTLFPLTIFGAMLLLIFKKKRIDYRKLKRNYFLAIHTLRIVVELVLYQLYLQAKIPKLMTYHGWNFDIIIGCTALVLLIYFFFHDKKINERLLFVWNIIGMIFLFIIVSLAVLSSPLPIQQLAFDQPNIAILELPYCFLPTCVVPIVLMSHILLFYKNDKVV